MVADVIEAMSSHRPYRSAISLDMSLEEITPKSGILFDTEIVRLYMDLYKNKGFKYNSA
ncbi:MAG: hypothetical protein JW967_01715 [Dehalococcoidales bacterium]|nr:hypothetical protein [Dehalococcoidales bacterium]